MRLRIHHGAVQVGGNCIELESRGMTLLLDLGLPLDSEPRLPDVLGLCELDPTFLGVVLSHPHLDHYGLLQKARSDVPVWLGRGAGRLLAAAAPFTAGAALPQRITSYDDRVPFEIGPFRVTPYLMDHSAFDAHALLVEAEGRRIFYTGDFRGHGRKAWAFERFLADPPKRVDVLLMEGTTVGRQDDVARSERQVEDEAAALMRGHQGLALACFSGQNIDRFVTFLRAAIRSGRTLVIDAYMANLITALALASLPDPRSSSSLRVYLPANQKRMIVRKRRFDLIEPFASRRIYQQELSAGAGRFAMMIRASMLDDLRCVDLTGGCLLYSMWPGYLDRDSVDLRAWAADAGFAFHLVHSSGHAHVEDLTRMAKAVSPARLIPIHSAVPEQYAALFDRVDPLANGEWVDLSVPTEAVYTPARYR